MKKVLLTVSALGLGLALTASVAAAEVSFTAPGKYNITGLYLSAGNTSTAGMLAGVDDDGTTENVDMFHHSVYVYPKLIVNDSTRMIGEMRFIDRDILGEDPNTASDENMRVFKLWMEWDSPIGTISAGRMPGGTWGSKFLDNTGNRDRLKWANNFGGMTAYVVYQKSAEKDAFTGDSDEKDSAAYIPGVVFKSDIGQTDLAVMLTVVDQDNGDYTNTEIWYRGQYTLGGIKLDTEIQYAMGEDSSLDDISSLAAMANASMKIDTFTAGLLFFYGQGDLDADGDNEGYLTRNGVGNDYNPFVIATGDYFGLLNADKNGYLKALGMTTGDGDGDNPGFLALAMYGVFPVNDALTVNAALGHVWADESGTYDDQIGWEFDVGMSYKLLDNLTYSASLGYMSAGEMLEDVLGETNNILALVHSLTMTW